MKSFLLLRRKERLESYIDLLLRSELISAIVFSFGDFKKRSIDLSILPQEINYKEKMHRISDLSYLISMKKQ